MTTLVRAFIPGVQEFLQDRNPVFRRWPERDVVRAINFGLMAIYHYVSSVSARRIFWRTNGGTTQDLSVIPQADTMPPVDHDQRVIAVMRVICNCGTTILYASPTRGRAIPPPVDQHKKDLFDPRWREATGPEVREVMFDKQDRAVFDIYPIADQILEVEAMVMPRPVPAGGAPGSEIYLEGGSNTEALPLPDEWVEPLTHYVSGYLLLKAGKATQDHAKGNLHATLFMNLLNTKVQAMTGKSPNLKALPYLQDGGEA